MIRLGNAMIHSYSMMDFVSSLPGLVEFRAIYIFDNRWQTYLQL